MTDSCIITDDLAQSFADSTVSVLWKMAEMKCVCSGRREMNDDSQHSDVVDCLDITAIIGFSGRRRGSVIMSMTNEIAQQAVGGMLGVDFEEINSDVCDGVGELVNVIAGSAKTKLQVMDIDFDLSIPNTVVGQNHQIKVSSGARSTHFDFATSAGAFFIEVYLRGN